MELKTNLQHRVAFQPSGVLLREEGGEGNTIEGVAIVTNTETVLYEDNDFREIEVIDKSCLSAEFLAQQDIKLNMLHERDLSFARNNKGKGTLAYEVREDGLHFSCPIPDCDLGQRAKALIENGTLTGCSFEFWAQDYEVSERKAEDGKTEYVIRHKSFARIGALTLGMDPAYESTSCGLREVFNAQRQTTDPNEEAKREAERKAEEEKKLREQIIRESEAREREIYLLTLHNH